MKIQYWGTAAAEGVPGIFCSCEVCKAARIKKGRCVRTRSQILINDDLLIDFGPDTYAHTLRYDFDMSRLGHVLITHPHEDHFYPDELTHRLEAYAKNPEKCEYLLPVLVSDLIGEGKADVLVLDNEDKWYGVTYKADKPVVVEAFKKLKADGVYPENF